MNRSAGTPGFKVRFEPRIDCQEPIPCDPCARVCPNHAITVGPSLADLPQLEASKCSGCGKCVAVCPGWAIRLIDWGYVSGWVLLTVPWEWPWAPEPGSWVKATGEAGEDITWARVQQVEMKADGDRGGGTRLLQLAVPRRWVDAVWSVTRPRAER